MPSSVIEAIQQGIWDYEPEDSGRNEYSSTDALPGTEEKLEILADRLSQGKPLWHPEDRLTYADPLRQQALMSALTRAKPR